MCGLIVQDRLHPLPGSGRGSWGVGGDSLTLTHVEGGELGREDVKLKRRIGWKKKQTDVI